MARLQHIQSAVVASLWRARSKSGSRAWQPLGAGSLRFRDLFDDRGSALRLAKSRGHVGLRDDADDLLVGVYYRDPSHLVLFHCLERFLQVVIRLARDGAGGHHVLYSRADNIAILSDDSQCQIAISNDAEQTLRFFILDDRND